MSGEGRTSSLERQLATMLQVGTGIGSCIIAAGWAMSVIGGAISGIGGAVALQAVAVATVRAGIALFILLPGARVLLMAVVFMRQRDYRFGAIAALVLTIIILGAALGVRTAGAYPTP